MITRAYVLLFVLAASLTPASAHEVVVYQQVAVTLAPAGTRLVVRLHVPTAAAGGATLPLDVIAADIARNLDLQQNDEALPAPSVRVQANADGISFDVELAYAVRGDGLPLSARLNRLSPVSPDCRVVRPALMLILKQVSPHTKGISHTARRRRSANKIAPLPPVLLSRATNSSPP